MNNVLNMIEATLKRLGCLAKTAATPTLKQALETAKAEAKQLVLAEAAAIASAAAAPAPPAPALASAPPAPPAPGAK